MLLDLGKWLYRQRRYAIASERTRWAGVGCRLGTRREVLGSGGARRLWSLCAAALLVLFGLAGRAQPLDDLQAVNMYALAARQVGLPAPDRPPTLHMVSQQQLQEIAGCGKCLARGLQIGADIYLDETLDFGDPQDASILLHEYVHYLQWAAHGPATSCREWVVRELEAYGIQAFALSQANVNVMPLLMAARLAQGSCR